MYNYICYYIYLCEGGKKWTLELHLTKEEHNWGCYKQLNIHRKKPS